MLTSYLLFKDILATMFLLPLTLDASLIILKIEIETIIMTTLQELMRGGLI